MNALLDLNIIIDVAINRPGFANDSAPVWKAHVNNQFDGLLAATEITNLFYILSKLIDRETALKTVNMCLKDFQIVSLGHAELSTAAKMPGKDDAWQGLRRQRRHRLCGTGCGGLYYHP